MINKAGCIVIDKNSKKVALIYRKNRNDYSFPKGHLEGKETLIECAIRETEEEIKRIPIILKNTPITLEHYYDSNNDEVTVYYYLASDGGHSDNKSTDTHDLLWTDFDKVEGFLTYDDSKETWNKIKEEVLLYYN